MAFYLATIAFNGFRWLRAIGNNVMVLMDLCGLNEDVEYCKSLKAKNVERKLDIVICELTIFDQDKPRLTKDCKK